MKATRTRPASPADRERRSAAALFINYRPACCEVVHPSQQHYVRRLFSSSVHGGNSAGTLLTPPSQQRRVSYTTLAGLSSSGSNHMAWRTLARREPASMPHGPSLTFEGGARSTLCGRSARCRLDVLSPSACHRGEEARERTGPVELGCPTWSVREISGPFSTRWRPVCSGCWPRRLRG